MNSRQCEQNVGWRRKVAINLCPLTWWTRLRMAPRRRLRPARSLNSLLTATVVGVVPWGMVAAWSVREEGRLVMDRRIKVKRVLTLPFQVNRDMHLAHGLQVHPKVLLLLFAVREVLERDIAVGHKVVGRNRGVVEHG